MTPLSHGSSLVYALPIGKLQKNPAGSLLKKGQGTGMIYSANILLQKDSCPCPSRKSCVWEDNRLAKIRNELLLYCLKKNQKCGLRSSSVTCQRSKFNLLLRAVGLNVCCSWQQMLCMQTGGTQCTSLLVQMVEMKDGWSTSGYCFLAGAHMLQEKQICSVFLWVSELSQVWQGWLDFVQRDRNWEIIPSFLLFG